MVVSKLIACGLILAVCISGAQAYVLSFDDIPAGSNLQYYSDQYGAAFSEGFQAADHTGSAWGLPHSGTKVLVWTGDSSHPAQFTFGSGNLGGAGSIAPYSISSLSGYFSTDAGMVIRALGFRNGLPFPVLDKQIGILAPDQSWDNVYIELRADDGGVLDYVKFEGLNSADARLGFCADDITITTAQ